MRKGKGIKNSNNLTQHGGSSGISKNKTSLRIRIRDLHNRKKRDPSYRIILDRIPV